jgi:hypothetical protein
MAPTHLSRLMSAGPCSKLNIECWTLEQTKDCIRDPFVRVARAFKQCVCPCQNKGPNGERNPAVRRQKDSTTAIKVLEMLNLWAHWRLGIIPVESIFQQLRISFKKCQSVTGCFLLGKIAL